jgi:hypothetical protein
MTLVKRTFIFGTSQCHREDWHYNQGYQYNNFHKIYVMSGKIPATADEKLALKNSEIFYQTPAYKLLDSQGHVFLQPRLSHFFNNKPRMSKKLMCMPLSTLSHIITEVLL